MKQRFGGLLCLAFGAVLIFSGVNFSTAAGAVGGIVPSTTVTSTAPVKPVDPCESFFPSAQRRAAPAGFCPIGTITVTVTTVAGDSTPPDAWVVTVASSNCVVSTEQPTQNASSSGASEVTFDGLNVYTGFDEATQCSYTLSEDNETQPFAATFTPAGPYTFEDGAVQSGFRPHIAGLAQPVALLNAAPVATSSVPPAPTSSASIAPTDASSTATVLPPLPPLTPRDATPSASAAPVLATTGPHGPVRGTLLAGIALCLLGGVLLVAGRRPRTRRHA